MAVLHSTSCPLHGSLLFFIALLIAIHPLIAEAGGLTTQTKALIFPISKDSKTLQYRTQIEQRMPQVNVSLVLDLGGVYLWTNCETDYVSSSYKSAKCAQLNAIYSNQGNATVLATLNVSKPGCNDYSCDVNVYNTVTRISTGGEVHMD